jgi:hypothetical protein
MATTKDYPSYLPDDFKGLDSIQEGNQRYYYKRSADGKTNLLYGAIIGKCHMIIRYPEGGTITPGVPIPAGTVDTAAIIDGAVEMEDLNQEVKDTMMTGDDRVTQDDIDKFNV